MRKQDRIANQQQRGPEKPRKDELQPDRMQREEVKGGASEMQRPQRQPGKLPLPD